MDYKIFTNANGLLMATANNKRLAAFMRGDVWVVGATLKEYDSDDEYIAHDFYGIARNCDSYESAAEILEERAIHIAQEAILGRVRVSVRDPSVSPNISTPWGTADSATIYTAGITRYSTPSHGGIHLSDELNAQVHELYRNENAFYEEDCEWSVVAITFPNLFTDFEKKIADLTLLDLNPGKYEIVIEGAQKQDATPATTL